jgi:hypothetical protein
MNSGHSAVYRHSNHAIGGTARSWAPDHGEGTPCPARFRRVGLAGSDIAHPVSKPWQEQHFRVTPFGLFPARGRISQAFTVRGLRPGGAEVVHPAQGSVAHARSQPVS